MTQPSPESPEARHRRGRPALSRLRPSVRAIEVAKRVVVGTFNDGFTHAGNLAYLSLLTLFPFFIVAAAIARAFGRSDDSVHAVSAFLETVPAEVASVLQQPILDVLQARSGSLLWLGALVGLWTTTGFIETVRSILRQAYGVPFSRPFWEYRLGSIGLIVGSVVLLMVAFSLQVVLVGVEQLIYRALPFLAPYAAYLSIAKLFPALALLLALYILFYTLAPKRYRQSGCPKWPGAVATAGVWIGTTQLLPLTLDMLGGYDRTYGSLAGVMIALFFFYIVGLGVVIGGELNAALAETPEAALEGPTDEEKGKVA
ncbi:YihY/virulence factor BrkB family protein [Sphingomonas sp. Leaf25]|uniref:YihY/virulence factor BrkB family protein n=1 Tax=Sphingomonas sp. Leaf25 TaxID=1735692 RepID=UPI0006FCE121|nr:YihY/virulence factor BrkB family protein [Sphingomonas sp. Leaf25]KQM98253.1 ribonuclease BN [Sphingomonas sp. Leaf25]